MDRGWRDVIYTSEMGPLLIIKAARLEVGSARPRRGFDVHAAVLRVRGGGCATS